jgi:hypothetical protein
MVATVVSALVQVPVIGVLDSNVVAASQTDIVPAIAAGVSFTVIVVVFLQPVAAMR